MTPDGPDIDKHALKHPRYNRHWMLGYNYRMSPLVAAAGLRRLTHPSFHDDGSVGIQLASSGKTWAARCVLQRIEAASLYKQAVNSCDWLRPQRVPLGWRHDYWTYAVACHEPEQAVWLLDAMERHGGQRPYPAWRLTYQEPAFRYLCEPGKCPVAEHLQPRLLQFQTHKWHAAERNAEALWKCIQEA